MALISPTWPAVDHLNKSHPHVAIRVQDQVSGSLDGSIAPYWEPRPTSHSLLKTSFYFFLISPQVLVQTQPYPVLYIGLLSSTKLQSCTVAAEQETSMLQRSRARRLQRYGNRPIFVFTKHHRCNTIAVLNMLILHQRTSKPIAPRPPPHPQPVLRSPPTHRKTTHTWAAAALETGTSPLSSKRREPLRSQAIPRRSPHLPSLR